MDQDSLIKLYEFYLVRFKEASEAVRDIANQSLYVILGVIAVFGVIIAGILESEILFNHKMFSLGTLLVIYSIVSLVIYGWSEKIMRRQYSRWLDIVSTLNKLDSLLGFADELSDIQRNRLKSFKRDRYIIPERYVEVGAYNIEDFKHNLLECKKSNFFCDFKDLIRKFKIGSIGCLLIGSAIIVLYFPIFDILDVFHAVFRRLANRIY